MNKPILDPFLMSLIAFAMLLAGGLLVSQDSGLLESSGVFLMLWGNNIARDIKRNLENRYE